MSAIISLIRSVLMLAIILSLAGTLAQATGWIGGKAVHANQHDVISFRRLNNELNLHAH